MRVGMMSVMAACMALLAGDVARGQSVVFSTFGSADTFSTTAPLVVGRQSVVTNVIGAKFTSTGIGVINGAQVALGPTTPAGQQVTMVARIFGHNSATGLPTTANDTMVAQTVTLGAAQILTFQSTQFLSVQAGSPITGWMVISLEEPVASGRTVSWNKSPTATGTVAVNTNGAGFVIQGTSVAMPAFKLLGEGFNGACCNHATGQCILTGHLECTRWTGFTYDVLSLCTPTNCPAACPADFDGNGVLAVGDIFAYLAAWFAGCP